MIALAPWTVIWVRRKPCRQLIRHQYWTSDIGLEKIVNKINDCPESEKIEEYILNKTGVINKVLMPLLYLCNIFPSTHADNYRNRGDIVRTQNQDTQ